MTGALEPVLRLCEVDGVGLPGVVVEGRELSHYSDVRVLTGPPAARHPVLLATLRGRRCVLKEYSLDAPSAWRRLQREVRRENADDQAR